MAAQITVYPYTSNMPDSDKELKIRITTAADTSALKQTADALSRVSEAAKNGALSVSALHGSAGDLPEGFPFSRGAKETPAASDPLAGIIELVGLIVRAAVDKVKEQGNAINTLHPEIKSSQSESAIGRPTAAGDPDASAQSPSGSAPAVEQSGGAVQAAGEPENIFTTIGSLIAGHNAVLNEAAKLVAAAEANNQNFLDAFRRINATADKMATASQASKAALDRVDRAIDQLSRAVSELNSRTNSATIHTPP
jgi:hypothetical protein